MTNSYQIDRNVLPTAANSYMVGNDNGWASKSWKATAVHTIVSGVLQNEAMNCGIPLIYNITQGLDDIRVRFTYYCNHTSTEPTPEIIIRPYKWTCGGFNGGQNMNLTSLGAEQTLTLINIGGNFWYGCADFTWNATASVNAETDKIYFGWRSNSTSADSYTQAGGITIKAWVEAGTL